MFFLFLVEKRRLSSPVLSPFSQWGAPGREGGRATVFFLSPFFGGGSEEEERGFLWGSVSSVTGGERL